MRDNEPPLTPHPTDSPAPGLLWPTEVGLARVAANWGRVLGASLFPHAGSVFAGLAQTVNSGHMKCSVGRTSLICPGHGTVVNGWLDQLGLLSTFVNDHCQVLLGLQEKGFTWLAEQLYSVTNPNAESVGRGLNMMEQYQAQADTFWILIRRLETRNYSVQESHVPWQLQPRHGCCSKCYSLS